MPDRVPIWARPARGPVPEPFTWFSLVLRVVGVPCLALLWWALAFLPWKVAGSASLADGWPPTLPVLYVDLEVATFGSAGAALFAAALLRRSGMSFLSVMLGFLASLAVTLTLGADLQGSLLGTTERQLMLGVSGVAAVVGLAIGLVANDSLRRLGFLGLLAVWPVVSLVAVVFLGENADRRWLTGALLAVLLVMIAWRRWSSVLLWPLFFAIYWVLTLVRSAVGQGAQTLRDPLDGKSAAGSVIDEARAAVGSDWGTYLGSSWDAFWPAALIGALVVAGVHVWRRGAPAPAPA